MSDIDRLELVEFVEPSATPAIKEFAMNRLLDAATAALTLSAQAQAPPLAASFA